MSLTTLWPSIMRVGTKMARIITYNNWLYYCFEELKLRHNTINKAIPSDPMLIARRKSRVVVSFPSSVHIFLIKVGRIHG